MGEIGTVFENKHRHHSVYYRINVAATEISDHNSIKSGVFSSFSTRWNKTKTRRERLKSALYLRLKKRKTFFFGKKLEIFEKKILSENVAQCRKI